MPNTVRIAAAAMTADWTIQTAMAHLESRIGAVEKAIEIALDAQRAQTALMFRVLTSALIVVGLLMPAATLFISTRG